jgi:hypothetical protein
MVWYAMREDFVPVSTLLGVVDAISVSIELML